VIFNNGDDKEEEEEIEETGETKETETGAQVEQVEGYGVLWDYDQYGRVFWKYPNV
jgi:hypothetical protein